MKRILLAVLLALCVGSLSAQSDAPKNRYQSATVVHVDEHMMPANLIGGVVENGVPQPQRYTYDVSVRLNCDIYDIRYESTVNHLPSMFSVNSTVSVRRDDDWMDVATPDSNHVLKLGIVSKHRADDLACASKE